MKDREFMTDWFKRRNQAVIDALPAPRLLVFSPKEGWGPLCSFLGIAVPNGPFPRINSRDEIGQASKELGGLPSDPETAETGARAYSSNSRPRAFGGWLDCALCSWPLAAYLGSLESRGCSLWAALLRCAALTALWSWATSISFSGGGAGPPILG